MSKRGIRNDLYRLLQSLRNLTRCLPSWIVHNSIPFVQRYTEVYERDCDEPRPCLLETRPRSRVSTGRVFRFKHVVQRLTYFCQGCTHRLYMAFDLGFISTDLLQMRVCFTSQSCTVQMRQHMYEMCDFILASAR